MQQVAVNGARLAISEANAAGGVLGRQVELVGVSALPIIGLMSFLIGIVIAQQGAVQLAAFGAETLTVRG